MGKLRLRGHMLAPYLRGNPLMGAEVCPFPEPGPPLDLLLRKPGDGTHHMEVSGLVVRTGAGRGSPHSYSPSLGQL